MTERICDQCQKGTSPSSEICPYCGAVFKTHETTLRCKTHGATYKGCVSATGEILSGHCPMCMESEDQEIARIEQEITTQESILDALNREAQGKRILNLDVRIWGIVILLLAAIGILLGGGLSLWYLIASFLDIFAAVYLMITFLYPTLPLSPQWVTAPKQEEIRKRIADLVQKKKVLIQRSIQKESP